MPEKFFDILSPQPVKTPTSESLPRSLPKKKPSKRKIGLILIFVGILILGAIFSYFSLSRTQIEIWPETKTLNYKEKIEINTQQNQSDFGAKIFPGKVFNVEIETSQDFPSTGKISKEEKAQGQIRIYNAYSDSPQALLANTRFISAEGKLFKSVEKIIIPGGTYDEKGKLVPGSVDIQVVAAEAGTEYNIGPSTFSVPGFAGTPKYTAFYGKSSTAMTGGFRGEAARVTQEDLDKAKNSLTDKLFEEGNTDLNNKISSDFVLLKEALKEETAEFTVSAQVGAETPTFNLKLKMRLEVLTFKKSDLENFAKGFLLVQIPETEAPANSFWSKEKIQEESFKIDYEFSSIDWKVEKMILNLVITAKIYPDIQEDALKKALLGKSLKEAQVLLADQPKIKKTEIKFWPFWVEKIPQREEKIEIKLNFEG